MILYRTVGFTEFAKILLFQTIHGQQQESCYCFENIGNEMVSMKTMLRRGEPKSFVCGFPKPFFWGRGESVLLELDIPDENCTWGIGRYFSGVHNPYLEYVGNLGFDYWQLMKASRNVIGNDVPEVHFPSYDIHNIRSVYFPTEIRTMENWEGEEVISNPEYFNELWRIFWNTLPRKYMYAYYTKCSIYPYLDCMMDSLTMGVLKAALTKLFIQGNEFDALISDKDVLNRVLSTFKTGSATTLEKQLTRRNLGFKRSLAVDEVDKMLQITFGVGCYGTCGPSAEFCNLKTADESSEIFQSIWHDFEDFLDGYSYADVYREHTQEVKNLIWSLATNAGII